MKIPATGNAGYSGRPFNSPGNPYEPFYPQDIQQPELNKNLPGLLIRFY